MAQGEFQIITLAMILYTHFSHQITDYSHEEIEGSCHKESYVADGIELRWVLDITR